MKIRFAVLVGTAMSLVAIATADAAGISVGAAPKGEAQFVASKIIKDNHPTCKKVSGAKRRPDGSISAQCDGANFLVFTVFNPKEGRTLELALNCSAAKKHLNVGC
ncbi:hypothetical protein LK542_02765 [Massilia sp. IC2-477]|uniref:hypothetical protein n=1 Tax=Massilia sp. IC2-477 TaxID=2887198 RepID=UPI001D0FDED9|nr:hypothetical protein [Massilia sp. IC2-477]MCC2954534.1 hypothetical protein [Massilia sp. IC2-477]